MTHAAFITSLTRSVRAAGAAEALGELRAHQPMLAGQPYHDTLAVFYVCAVDRLVQAGLSDFGVLWHPLVDQASITAWYPIEVLRTDAARDHFVPSPLALDVEPQPCEPTAVTVAA
jgi:hypothetical protein